MLQELQRLTLLALDVQGLLTLLLVSLSSGLSSNFVVDVPAVHQRVNKQRCLLYLGITTDELCQIPI